ncbi:hypothetical protein C4E44_04545 [Pseudomonas sp. MWU12-2312b]|nr:hypothetical protein C4E44_04545 [Pseudomonas sp. MWU12-2312b]
MFITTLVVWVGYLVSRLSTGLAFAGVFTYAIYTSGTWSQGFQVGLLMCLAVFVLGVSVAFLTAGIRRVFTRAE